jgi:hypothetical protein
MKLQQPYSLHFQKACRVAFAIACAVFCVSLAHAQGFTAPTPEELSMKSLPNYPGAPALYLYQEEITNDDLHVHQYYVRIKVLTEEGKRYANVELPFVNLQDADGPNNQMTGIQARTIHSDGTIVPFTGKPYLKTVEKDNQYKVEERVFTLPDVEVGSILEYRYSWRYDDNYFEAPDWYIQKDIFVKSAHYVWLPTSKELIDGDVDAPVNTITWFPVLPEGAKVQPTTLPNRDAMGREQHKYELTIKDVPPTIKEEYMPPIGSFTYRVLFNFTAFHDGQEFWKVKGKKWSKHADSFIGPNGDLRQATKEVIGDAATDDLKLHKIYAAVMTIENTAYTREHQRDEDKVAGLAKVSNAFDVWKNKRGSGDQITMLFIGMARAAGLKAYYMTVTSRSDSLFVPNWLNFSQLDSTLAVVNVGGKETYFDPGARYCQYGHLTWGDSFASGVRQVDGGTAFGNAPGDLYTSNQEGRTGNFTMDEHGNITGKIVMSYTGDHALTWRQRALRGDTDSLHHSLKESMEAQIPKSLQIEVGTITDIDNYEKPLQVEYTVKGTLGTVTGKRMIIPVDIFVAESKPAFTHEKRELAVYFEYPELIRDATRINFPASMSVEAAPTSSSASIKNRALYQLEITPAPTSITVRRTFGFNDIVVKQEEYQELRTYYQQFETKDHDSIVLKTAASPSTPAAGAGNTAGAGN